MKKKYRNWREKKGNTRPFHFFLYRTDITGQDVMCHDGPGEKDQKCGDEHTDGGGPPDPELVVDAVVALATPDQHVLLAGCDHTQRKSWQQG